MKSPYHKKSQELKEEPEFSRRDILKAAGITLGAGIGITGWRAADYAGELTFENPPNDLDGDGLFEDLNGDGEFNTQDLLMYTHESNEDSMSKQLSHAFDYSKGVSYSPVGIPGSDFQALIYGLTGEKINRPKGEAIKFNIYQPSSFSEQQIDQIATQISSAMNNASLTEERWSEELLDSESNWYADVSTFPAPDSLNFDQDLDSLLEDFMDEIQRDGFNILLRSGGEPQSHSFHDHPYAVAAGVETAYNDIEGTPLLIPSRQEFESSEWVNYPPEITILRSAAKAAGVEPLDSSRDDNLYLMKDDDFWDAEVSNIIGPMANENISFGSNVENTYFSTVYSPELELNFS